MVLLSLPVWGRFPRCTHLDPFQLKSSVINWHGSKLVRIGYETMKFSHLETDLTWFQLSNEASEWKCSGTVSSVNGYLFGSYPSGSANKTLWIRYGSVPFWIHASVNEVWRHAEWHVTILQFNLEQWCWCRMRLLFKLGFHIIFTFFWIAVSNSSDLSDPSNLWKHVWRILATAKISITGIERCSIPAIH